MVSLMTPPQNIALNNEDLYLSEEPFVEISSGKLADFAHQFTSTSPRERVTKIYDWVAKSIRSTSYSGKPRGALYAFHKRKGDCTEFMHLFIALCRLNNVPARGVSGFIVTRDKRLQPDDFHDWAEVYVDGTWQLVDPFNKVFMEKENEYIAQRLHNPKGGKFTFHRWESDNTHLKIVMTP